MAPAKTPIRRTLLVSPGFQLKLLLGANLLTLALIGLLGAMTYVFVAKLHAQALQSGFSELHPLQVFLTARERGLYSLFGFVAFVSCISVSLTVLVLSHRIAGPIYRLQKHLEGIVEGRAVGELKFRPRDFFQSLVPLYNQAFKISHEKNSRQSEKSRTAQSA